MPLKMELPLKMAKRRKNFDRKNMVRLQFFYLADFFGTYCTWMTRYFSNLFQGFWQPRSHWQRGHDKPALFHLHPDCHLFHFSVKKPVEWDRREQSHCSGFFLIHSFFTYGNLIAFLSVIFFEENKIFKDLWGYFNI